MDYSIKLAKYCHNISFKDLPPDVVHKAKLCVLDYIANIYGSLELEAVASVVSFVKSLGGPQAATALACGFKTGLQNAAFINGTTAEAIEAQDGYRFGGNHPGTGVIPASLVLAEHLNLGGEEIIEAVVAGYEASNRPAAAMHPYHTLSGFLPTGTCCTFGAAVAAAKLFKLNEAGMLNSLGNAGYLVPISMAEQLMGGCTIKIVQGGQAASSGIMAAGLAGRGVTGHHQVLEGSDLKGGFTQITVKAEPVFDRITDRLGEHYTIMDVYFKPYTACRHTHGAAQAVLELLKENNISTGDIESVTVYSYGIALIAVGKGITKESTFVTAQFSIPHVVAACLLDGDLGPKQLTEKRIADPALLELSQKVTVAGDDELNKVYPEKTSSRVEINMKDGKRLVRQVDIPKGDPRDPMEAGDLAAKVKRFGGGRDTKKMERVIDMVLNLEKLKDMKELAGLI